MKKIIFVVLLFISLSLLPVNTKAPAPSPTPFPKYEEVVPSPTPRPTITSHSSQPKPILSKIEIKTNPVAHDTLIDAVNKRRAENGKGELTINTQLNNSAYTKACDMKDRGYWAHNTPEGITPWEFITAAGYSYRYAGENLAEGYGGVDSVIVQKWFESKTHHDVMLDSNYKEIGIGRCGVYVAMHLGSR